MSKDLLCDKYGRFYEIPIILNKLGHDMVCVCANYHRINNNYINSDILFWRNFDFDKTIISGTIKYYYFLSKLVETEKPDLIIGLSDMFQVILSGILSSRYNIPYIVDLYDNFESYGASKIPGLKYLFQRSLNGANGISVISPELKEYIEKKYRLTGKIKVVENAVDIKLFHPLNKANAREKYGFPENAIIIGYAGALSEKRGVDVLFSAYLRLLEKYDNIYLALAGPIDKSRKVLKLRGTFYVGQLPYTEIPSFFNTLDVGVIINKDDDFGKYCFPQKFCEMISCQVPIVASNIGVMARMLSEYPQILFRPEDVADLSRVIENQINNPVLLKNEILTWENQGYKFFNLINECS